jgi:hypothetical protein
LLDFLGKLELSKKLQIIQNPPKALQNLAQKIKIKSQLFEEKFLFKIKLKKDSNFDHPFVHLFNFCVKNL